MKKITVEATWDGQQFMCHVKAVGDAGEFEDLGGHEPAKAPTDQDMFELTQRSLSRAAQNRQRQHP